MKLDDLLKQEKAARVVCQKYEKSLRNYDLTIKEDKDLNEKFKKYNELYSEILIKIEKELDKLIDEEKIDAFVTAGNVSEVYGLWMSKKSKQRRKI